MRRDVMFCSLARLWTFSVDHWFVTAMRGLRGVAHSQAAKKIGANSEGWREGPESRNYAPFLKLGLLMLTSWTTTFSTIPTRNIMLYVSVSKDFTTALCQSAFSKHSIDMPESMVHQSFWIEVCDLWSMFQWFLNPMIEDVWICFWKIREATSRWQFLRI